MTRTTEQIDPYREAARKAHQDAVEAAASKQRKAADLEAKADARDPSVTAQDLLQAQNEAAFAKRGIPALFQVVQDLEAEHREAEKKETAKEWATTEAVLRAEDERSDLAIEAAYERKLITWRAHAAHCEQVNHIANVRFDTYGMANDATSPIRRGAGGLIKVMGQDMRSRPVLEPLQRTFLKYIACLKGGHPKATR